VKEILRPSRWLEDRHKLFPRSLTAQDSHLRPRDVQAPGDKVSERFIRSIFDGRSGDPDLKALAMETRHLRALGAGLDMDRERPTLVGSPVPLLSHR